MLVATPATNPRSTNAWVATFRGGLIGGYDNNRMAPAKCHEFLRYSAT
jgi:hypothetical protein